MNITIIAKPVFWIPLSLKQAEILSVLSYRHYDRTCKSASLQGGFILAWCKAAHQAGSEQIQFSADFQHLDLCLKVLEASGTLINEEDRKIAAGLTLDFRRALAMADQQIGTISIETEPQGLVVNG
jgi:hypothetical protein